jgi:integrative and conjugative element protein (TIGR02256 family)
MHQQHSPRSVEAGGQIFARFKAPEIWIEEATEPRRTDKRGRTYYRPDRRAEQDEILERYKLGLHFIGDWHTHASPYHEPSPTDISNINECFVHSQHKLNGFVLIVVSTTTLPEGLRVSVHDGSQSIVLQAEPSAEG